MGSRGPAKVHPLSLARSPKLPEPAALSESSPLRLAAGRTLALDGEGRRLTLRAPSGQVELTVRITPEGPILSFSGAAVEIEQAGALELRADKLKLHAR